MDVDDTPIGQNVQVVDPEVRAYVYSLVTAVGSFPSHGNLMVGSSKLTISSSEALMAKMRGGTLWAMMPLHVYVISKSG
jgi:hypothetical protein